MFEQIVDLESKVVLEAIYERETSQVEREDATHLIIVSSTESFESRAPKNFTFS